MEGITGICGTVKPPPPPPPVGIVGIAGITGAEGIVGIPDAETENPEEAPGADADAGAAAAVPPSCRALSRRSEAFRIRVYSLGPVGAVGAAAPALGCGSRNAVVAPELPATGASNIESLRGKAGVPTAPPPNTSSTRPDEGVAPELDGPSSFCSSCVNPPLALDGGGSGIRPCGSG